jgi:hypothetical protein
MNLPATQRVGQSLESALHQVRRRSVTLIAASRHHVIIHGGLRAAGNARRKIDWQYAFTRSLALRFSSRPESILILGLASRSNGSRDDEKLSR